MSQGCLLTVPIFLYVLRPKPIWWKRLARGDARFKLLSSKLTVSLTIFGANWIGFKGDAGFVLKERSRRYISPRSTSLEVHIYGTCQWGNNFGRERMYSDIWDGSERCMMVSV